MEAGLDLIERYPAPELDDENIQLLYKAIDQLDPLEKSIVILYLEEQSYREISEIIGLSESYVGVKLNRLKIKIKEILKSYGVR